MKSDMNKYRRIMYVLKFRYRDLYRKHLLSICDITTDLSKCTTCILLLELFTLTFMFVHGVHISISFYNILLVAWK